MLRDRILDAHYAPAEIGQRSFRALFARVRKSGDLQLEYELTDFIRALALLVQNGVPVMVAFAWLGPRCSGKLGPMLTAINQELALGASLAAALEMIQQPAAGQIGEELAQKISVSLERGTPLAEQLNQLAATARSQSVARLLRQSGSNETKMLIPTIFVILPVTVLFAIYPSLSLLGSNL